MSTIHPAMPGHLPLAAGKSVVLEPRLCGEVRVGAGAVHVGGKLLLAGDRVRLRGGERIAMENTSAGPALYSWDLCEAQPRWGERVRAAAAQLLRAIAARPGPELRACARSTWCLAD